MSTLSMTKKKDPTDGTHEAQVTDVVIKKGSNKQDYAIVFFEMEDGTEYSDVIFSNFSGKDVFASKAYDFLGGEGYESDIDLDDLFNQSCTVTLEQKGKYQKITDIEFHL